MMALTSVFRGSFMINEVKLLDLRVILPGLMYPKALKSLLEWILIILFFVKVICNETNVSKRGKHKVRMHQVLAF